MAPFTDNIFAHVDLFIYLFLMSIQQDSATICSPSHSGGAERKERKRMLFLHPRKDGT